MPKAIIIDHGTNVNLASRLARDTEVAYFSSWANAYPVVKELAPGFGLKNVERVNNPIQFMLQGKASHVIIPDLYCRDYYELAKALEIPVLGAGAGEDLELDRWKLKEFLEANELAVGEAWFIEGMGELSDFLSKNDEKYVKISTFRGDLETHHHETWESTRPEFYRWALRFGALGGQIPFVVEEPIPDAKELGFDTFFRDGWVFPCYLGQEIKDSGYIGYQIDSWPAKFRPIMEALGRHFAAAGYNWFFSNEMRDQYMTDATCRIPSPPGGAMMASMSNFTDFLLKDKAPDWGGEYICEIVLKSRTLEESWMQVDIPKSVKDRIMLHNYCEVKGKTWVIPHDSQFIEFGSACGWGDMKEACEMALEAANAIKADGLYFDDHVLEKASELLEDS